MSSVGNRYNIVCKFLGVTWPEMLQQGYYIKFFVGETLLYNDKFVWIGRVILKKTRKFEKFTSTTMLKNGQMRSFNKVSFRPLKDWNVSLIHPWQKAFKFVRIKSRVFYKRRENSKITLTKCKNLLHNHEANLIQTWHKAVKFVQIKGYAKINA